MILAQIVAQYGKAELAWMQEEPKNMGAWLYVKPRLDTALRELYGGQVSSSKHSAMVSATGRFNNRPDILIAARRNHRETNRCSSHET